MVQKKIVWFDFAFFAVLFLLLLSPLVALFIKSFMDSPSSTRPHGGLGMASVWMFH